MEDEKNKQGVLSISGLLIALTALGVFTFTQVPFRGTRPFVPETDEYLEKINARLWQDPFGAVLDYYTQPTEKQFAKGAGVLYLDGGSPGSDANEKSLKAQIDKHLSSPSGGGSVTVLGVMVFGGPYAADVEWRLRQRYAVLSALGRKGYVPEDAGHIDFVQIKYRKSSGESGDGVDEPEEAELRQGPLKLTRSNILPFEWFSHRKNDDESVLLLWINDPIFSETPLEKIAWLARGLGFQDKGDPDTVSVFRENLRFKIVGPAGSGRLQEMVKELKEPDRHLDGLEIFSATATIAESFLLENLEQESRRKGLPQLFEECGIDFHRTISTDRVLAGEIVDELDLRGVKPKEENHVMLVAEWDTLYGRSLPRAYEQVLTERGFCSKSIIRMNYLRGLDGILPGSEGKKEGAEVDGKEDSRDVKKLEKPVGKSQYDYLRRLAGETYRLNQDLIRSSEGSIRAIGVLGSDFYDKYLVLQALRQKFPDVLFFTHDLDARFLHPENLQWTRNLIVASSFDIRHADMGWEGIPPFRDNYQMSVYRAVLEALDPARNPEVHISVPGPKVFEIGRYSAVELSKKDNHILADIRKSLGDNEELILKCIAISVLLVILICLTSERARILMLKLAFDKSAILFFIFLISICALILVTSMTPGQETLSFFEGVSIWPTELIRLLTLLLAVLFLVKSQSYLKSNADDIDAYFVFSEHSCSSRNRNKNKYVGQLWSDYLEDEKWVRRKIRILPIIAVYFILCMFLIYTFGKPEVPVRGSFSLYVDKFIIFSTVFAFLILNFFVFDVTRNLKRFISRASDKPFWDEDTLAAFLGKTPDENDHLTKEWMLITLIGKRTDAVGKLVFYPFIIWLLLFLARIRYVDNWHMPLGLSFVLALGAIYVWVSGFVLRRSAEKARAAAIQRLSKCLAVAVSRGDSRKERVEQIRFELEEVRAIRQGAFAPFTQHPVLHSLLIPFGGVGGVYLLEFLGR